MPGCSPFRRPAEGSRGRAQSGPTGPGVAPSLPPPSPPPRAARPSVRVIGELPSLKDLPSPLKVLLTDFFIFFFLYLFKETCNFFLSFSPLAFFFLVPSVPLNSLKLALCLLTPN